MHCSLDYVLNIMTCCNDGNSLANLSAHGTACDLCIPNLYVQEEERVRKLIEITKPVDLPGLSRYICGANVYVLLFLPLHLCHCIVANCCYTIHLERQSRLMY